MAQSPGINWREIKEQAIAGTFVVLVTSIFGGIVFLIHKVPNQLDDVLKNQVRFRETQVEFKEELKSLKSKVDVHGEKIIRLEAAK